jgi:hypothetical protein
MWIFSADFYKNFLYQISQKSIQWEPPRRLLTGAQPDMTKITGDFSRLCEKRLEHT